MPIDLEKDLNPSQLEAVTTVQGPVLVIAGAGSGKTRTVVYRLAYLVNQGIAPESILLLTFTRKASQEMLTRAGNLLGQGLQGINGGTFHSFAYGILRQYGSALGFKNGLTVMDRGDSEEIIRQVKESSEIGKKDRSFPKKNTILSLLSKSRNKELDLVSLLEKESRHLLPYAEDLQSLDELYQKFKLQHSLVDYDDLLFYLENLLLENQNIKDFLSLRYSHIMVDEYQDTNLVQGRLVRHLSGKEDNLMVVGDDAQSIYSFRGATINNILCFTQDFPKTKIIKLEQNYRSTQPILTLSNQILEGAKEKYQKELFSTREQGIEPQILRPLSDLTQARVVVNKIQELSQNYPLHEIAVLFRSGYQSYPLELALNKVSLVFQKYGGIKFTEAAHIKDVLAHLRLVLNPTDLPAWQRAMSLVSGIGPKICQRLYNSMVQEDAQYLNDTCQKKPQLKTVMDLLSSLRQQNETPYNILQSILEYYQPLFQEKYSDDYPRRQPGLEQLSQIASAYQELDVFLSDMTLENPEQLVNNDPLQDYLILSTVHSAKGLEWSAAIIIDLVEERFPSKHAMMKAEDMEEERRLFYVACTRAKDYLAICVPESIYNRYQNRCDPVMPSPFIQELSQANFEELKENHSGFLTKTNTNKKTCQSKTKDKKEFSGSRQNTSSAKYGYCQHKIFGRGKVVQFISPNRYKVNFPGFGLKVIIGDYLQFE